MPKVMQNLVVLMEQTEEAHDISQKAGNMCFNRFCIDEGAAFELSAVRQFQNPMSHKPSATVKEIFAEKRAKGRGT